MSKYAHVRLIAKTPDDRETELLHPGEPFFLIRGHDKLGPAMIAVYAALGLTEGANTEGLLELQERMKAYQDANPGLVKLAD